MTDINPILENLRHTYDTFNQNYGKLTEQNIYMPPGMKIEKVFPHFDNPKYDVLPVLLSNNNTGELLICFRHRAMPSASKDILEKEGIAGANNALYFNFDINFSEGRRFYAYS